MTVKQFLSILPLILFGDFCFSYILAQDNTRWLAVIGASALFQAGLLMGIYLGNLPVVKDPE